MASPSIETPGASNIVFRFTLNGYSGQAAAVVLLDASGNPVTATTPNGGLVSGAGSPTLVAGSDGTNVRTLATDSGGNLRALGNTIITGATDGSDNNLMGFSQAANVVGVQRLLPVTANYYFNGVSWDRARGNVDGCFVTSVPSASTAGVIQFSAMSAASDNAQVLKAARGKVYGFQIFNTTASAKYVRLYNKATAPVAGDVPIRRIMVPANGVASYHVGQGLDGFTNGIGLRATGAPADADTTVLAAGDLIFNIDYA